MVQSSWSVSDAVSSIQQFKAWTNKKIAPKTCCFTITKTLKPFANAHPLRKLFEIDCFPSHQTSCHRIVFHIIQHLCFDLCNSEGLGIEIFTIQCALRKYLLTISIRCVFLWPGQTSPECLKSTLNPNSQRAFIDILTLYQMPFSFCSIVCLLREQIKLNKCERFGPFEQRPHCVCFRLLVYLLYSSRDSYHRLKLFNHLFFLLIHKSRRYFCSFADLDPNL